MFSSDVIKIPSISYFSMQPVRLSLSLIHLHWHGHNGSSVPTRFSRKYELRMGNPVCIIREKIPRGGGKHSWLSNNERFSCRLRALINPLSIRSHALLAPTKSRSAKANVYRATYQCGSECEFETGSSCTGDIVYLVSSMIVIIGVRRFDSVPTAMRSFRRCAG